MCGNIPKKSTIAEGYIITENTFRKLATGKKNIEGERVTVQSFASNDEINVIKKKKKANNTTILQYLTLPTCIDFKFISCSSTSSIRHKERETGGISAEMLNNMVNRRKVSVTKGK